MDKQRRVIALGFFDGVHLGHGALLRAVGARARELDALPCAFTFDRSPAAALTGRAVPLLTGVEDKNAVIEGIKLGICDYILKPFFPDDLLERIQRALGADEENQIQTEEES